MESDNGICRLLCRPVWIRSSPELRVTDHRDPSTVDTALHCFTLHHTTTLSKTALHYSSWPPWLPPMSSGGKALRYFAEPAHYQWSTIGRGLHHSLLHGSDKTNIQEISRTYWDKETNSTNKVTTFDWYADTSSNDLLVSCPSTQNEWNLIGTASFLSFFYLDI